MKKARVEVRACCHVRGASILILAILVATSSAHQINVPAQLSTSPDYVYQDVDSSVHVISPRKVRARYSIIIRNVQVKGLNSSVLGLDSRLASPGYTLSTTGVYDSAGDLVYELNRRDEKSPTLKVVFRRPVALGESYGFTYEYTVKWDYDSYEWSVSWSTSRVIEKIRLRISVSDPLRITRTTPAGPTQMTGKVLRHRHSMFREVLSSLVSHRRRENAPFWLCL